MAHSDLVRFVDLRLTDLRWLRTRRGDANQLGMAVQLCALRHLGFVPDDLAAAPPEVVAAVAERLGVEVITFDTYLDLDDRTVRDHRALIMKHAGWVLCGRGEWKQLADWLVERALEHDDTMVLFRDALAHLRASDVLRPSLNELMRAVGTARARADQELFDRLTPQLDTGQRSRLDDLIETNVSLGVAPLVWIHTKATKATAASITEEIRKRDLLEEVGATSLDVTMIAPERRRQLAAFGRRSSPKSLRRTPMERRYPVLVASVVDAHTAITDEIVHLFDRALSKAENSAARRSPRSRRPSPLATSTVCGCWTR